jgi:hypothetical protein
VSFLNQLKSQATALQREQNVQQHDLARAKEQTEAACKLAWYYLDDLAKQLNVISPTGPALSVDGKNRWPPMQLKAFKVDARKKMLRSQEVFDYVGMWWRIVPQTGNPVSTETTVNFPPDLERVETRLAQGQIKHERKEIRHPEKNTLLAIRFEFETETRGTVTLTPDHDKAEIAFRVTNTRGFEVVNVTRKAVDVKTELLDELAKLIVAQPSKFA